MQLLTERELALRAVLLLELRYLRLGFLLELFALRTSILLEGRVLLVGALFGLFGFVFVLLRRRRSHSQTPQAQAKRPKQLVAPQAHAGLQLSPGR